MYTEILSQVFEVRDTSFYNQWNASQVPTDPIYSVYNGTESASHLVTKIMEQISAEIKNKKPTDVFKRGIKN